MGEIRDGETAQLAIQAALTGHLVFSTIHTNTSIVLLHVFLIWELSHTLLPQCLLPLLGNVFQEELLMGWCSNWEMTPSLNLMIIQSVYCSLEYKKAFQINRAFYVQNQPVTQKPQQGVKGVYLFLRCFILQMRLKRQFCIIKEKKKLKNLHAQKEMVTIKEDAMLKCMDAYFDLLLAES